jgi:phosphoglycolate phosphatase-like HAD superfamily hydrolase
MTDPAATARAALGGIKEAVAVGREIKETAKEVNAFLDEEAKARVAWKRKQQQIERRGDMMFMNAYEEYKIIRQIRDAEADMYKQIELEYGRSAVSEVKSLITQMRKQHIELNDEMYRKRMETRREMLWIILASAVVYGIFKMMGLM